MKWTIRWGWITKRRVWAALAASTLGLLLLNGGCADSTQGQGAEINGKTPVEAVKTYQKAYIQKDGATLQEISTKKEGKLMAHFIDPRQGPMNKKTLPEDYQLVEYEANEETYYYKDKDEHTDFFKVIKTDEGWKVETLFADEFQSATEGLDPFEIGGTEE